ncbi:MAG: LysR family transcriptional regulator [Clostridiales bacterium]|nr:LysR family transcriptional regulator [Clostridiales bacterium]
MELNQLIYFKCVAQYENITKAAEELNITQPALSAVILRLEDSVGVQLFSREKKRIKLNSFGKVFLDYIDPILFSYEEALNAVRSAANADHVMVNVSGSIMEFSLIVEKYLSDNPDNHLRLSLDSRKHILNNIIDNEIDFGLVGFPVDDPRLEWYPALEYERLLLVNKNHSLAEKKYVQLNEFSKDKFLCNQFGIDRETTQDICRKFGFNPDIIFESSVGDLVKSFLAEGTGVAFAASTLLSDVSKIIDPFMNSPVKLIRFNDQRLIHMAGLVKRRGRLLSPASNIFFNYCLEYLAKLNANLKVETTKYFDI